MILNVGLTLMCTCMKYYSLIIIISIQRILLFCFILQKISLLRLFSMYFLPGSLRKDGLVLKDLGGLGSSLGSARDF